MDPETFCLAQNIYFEARNESTAGQIAVGQVTFNRVNSKRFPNNVCDVVYQGPKYESWNTRKDKTLSNYERVYYPVKNKCQFSWYCDGKADDILNAKKFSEIYVLAVEIARKIIPDITDGATHYHADYVSPEWANHLNKTVVIDTHIFYK
jgi:spore germination cell wall hydrolase CwlJ-like protein